MKIKINDDLKNILPNFQVIAYTMDVDNLKTKEVENKLEEIKQKYFNIDMLPNVVSIPKIKESRDGYKKLGKDPSHTRLACEALYRRVLKGDGLYRLGDIIDLGNILSVEIKRSVCVVDADKIESDVLKVDFRRVRANECLDYMYKSFTDDIKKLFEIGD